MKERVHYSTPTLWGDKMTVPHSRRMPYLDLPGMGRGHRAPLLGQSRAGLLCGNRVSSYTARGFLMLTAIKRIAAWPDTIRIITTIASILLRRPQRPHSEGETPIVLEMKRIQYRKDVLREVVTARLRDGFKVESQGEFHAALFKGKFLWKRRAIVEVDEWGEVHEEILS